MKNVSIKGICECNDLDRNIDLRDGSLVVHKKRDSILDVYFVVPFRDSKNKYNGDQTATYCTLVNLDTGKIAFEERCSRRTTERRMLRHLTKAGHSYPYNPDSIEKDYLYTNMTIQVYKNGKFKMNLELCEEDR